MNRSMLMTNSLRRLQRRCVSSWSVFSFSETLRACARWHAFRLAREVGIRPAPSPPTGTASCLPVVLSVPSIPASSYRTDFLQPLRRPGPSPSGNPAPRSAGIERLDRAAGFGSDAAKRVTLPADLKKEGVDVLARGTAQCSAAMIVSPSSIGKPISEWNRRSQLLPVRTRRRQPRRARLLHRDRPAASTNDAEEQVVRAVNPSMRRPGSSKEARGSADHRNPLATVFQSGAA